MKTITKKVIALLTALVVALTCIPTMPVSVSAAVNAPTGIEFVQNSDTSCTITWNSVSGATYNVYEAASRYATYSKVDTVSATSYTDDEYDGGYYKVTAVVGGTESELSDAASYEISVFGYDTVIFEGTDNTSDMQSYIDSVYDTTEAGQFISDRHAFLFAPGTYSDDLVVDIGFYTQVAGMGISPEDTVLGNIRCKAEWMISTKYDGSVNYSALCNFWRSVENLTTTAKSTMWAVSQATSMRRMNIQGDLYLHEEGGYASGGFLADSKIAGTVSSGSQQQWITRNSEMGNYESAVWNTVLVGCGETVKGAEATWPSGTNTVVAQTPEDAEKPFLTVDENGDYGVFVPEVTENTEGVSWDGDEVAGEVRSLDEFYVASPDDTAAEINAQLATGKSLILTPGVYKLSETINITNENTVVLGLGYATLEPTNGNQCMIVADVGGVVISGVLFDAGSKESSALLTVGVKNSTTGHADNPIVLVDTFYRVGGASTTPGKTETCVIINSNDVIGDNLWVWRADHGSGVGWDKNTADYGIIINGDNVTTYGLMVEHFQKYQTQWNGNGGKCYMYQSELPYDIPNQNSWNASGSYGYTDYKVASDVTTHEGYGIGIYSCYQAATCYLKSAIECPDTSGVKFTNVCTYSLSGNGSIDYAINTSGYGVWASGDMCKIMSYCNGVYTMDKTEDSAKNYIWSTTKKVNGKTLTSGSLKVKYTGKAKTPSVEIYYKGILLREGTDYTLTYENNKKIGTAKIVIKGINGFKDKTTFKFKIVPNKVKKLKKKSVTKKKITIKFSKVKGVKKYQVVYANNKKFKKKKTMTVKKTKATIKRDSSKNYYIKVRALKKVKKKTYYGAYSKTIKVKKSK